MTRRPLLGCRLLAATLATIACAAGSADAQNWPQFRGPAARGVLDGQALPVSWSPEEGDNIRWKTAIPGIGHSSPIVWGGRVFVTTAVSTQDEELVLGDEGGIALAEDSDEFSWRLYCLDAKSGEVLWQREAYAGTPRATRHVKASQANSTPATDGRVVVAVFGSQGLKAYDVDGKELWARDLGVLDPGLYGDPASHWGYASSPVIHDGVVFVQVDRHADSYVAAYRLADGTPVWRIERDEKPVWATPTVHVGPKRTQLIVIGGDFDRGLDPKTGVELWRFARDYEVKTPTPLVADDRIILSGGYRATPVQAVPLDASGTVTEAAWTSEPGGPYTPTPIAYGDHLFFTRNTGVLTVLSLANGETVHRSRLGGNFSASPVASDGKIYFPAEEGVVSVVTATPEPEILAQIDMGEPLMASPAISGQTLYLRTSGHLWAIGE